MARVGQTEPLDLVWRPFELRPEPAPPPPKDYIDRAWQQSVEPLSKQLGIHMIKPSRHPRTRLAHEAMAFAAQNGQAVALAHALFQAYFQQDLDIGSPAVICQLAGTVGLDPASLRHCLEQGTVREQVVADLALAQQAGITAVPTFIIGERLRLRGLVPEAQLRQAIEQARSE